MALTSLADAPSFESPLYFEMFQRNAPLIDWDIQKKIAEIRLAVAGCGSTGGAFADGAVRLGVLNFKLADQGTYEISNLNRQMVDSTCLDENKARAYSNKIKKINPMCMATSFPEGLTESNIDHFLADATLVFDAVDVTTESGMKMKLLLHERAAHLRLPVASALDLGFTQWIRSFDYRSGAKPLDGNLQAARKHTNPIKALLTGFITVDELPLEIVDEVLRLLESPVGTSACQLGSACFLLSALVSPYLLYFIKENKLPPKINVDLLSGFLSDHEKKTRKLTMQEKTRKLSKILGL